MNINFGPDSPSDQLTAIYSYNTHLVNKVLTELLFSEKLFFTPTNLSVKRFVSSAIGAKH
jgi:hypothetical protein